MSGGALDRSSSQQHAADSAGTEPAADLDDAPSRQAQRGAAADFRSHLEPHAPGPNAAPHAALKTGSIGTMAAAFLSVGDFAGEAFRLVPRRAPPLRLGWRVAGRPDARFRALGAPPLRVGVQLRPAHHDPD